MVYMMDIFFTVLMKTMHWPTLRHDCIHSPFPKTTGWTQYAKPWFYVKIQLFKEF